MGFSIPIALYFTSTTLPYPFYPTTLPYPSDKGGQKGTARNAIYNVVFIWDHLSLPKSYSLLWFVNHRLHLSSILCLSNA